MKFLYALVDYDNLERSDKSKGIDYIIEKIVNLLTPNDVTDRTHLRVRLYGGWYYKGTLSHAAQSLSSSISGKYPKIISSIKHSFALSVSAELAYSLLISPSEHLFNTFRRRQYSYELVCSHPHSLG